MEVQEATKPIIEYVQKSPRTRNALQEIDEALNHIEQIAAILKEHSELIDTLKLSAANNKEQVLTFTTSLETYKQTINSAIAAHTEGIKNLHEQLLNLITNYEKTELKLKNTVDERLKDLQERAYKTNTEAITLGTEALDLCTMQKNELKSLHDNFKKTQQENIILKSHVKLFGTMSTISLVGLVLAFWMWFDSYMGLSKRIER